jgi:hypothetical protein
MYCDEYGMICDGTGEVMTAEDDPMPPPPPPPQKKKKSRHGKRARIVGPEDPKRFAPEWQPRDGDETYWDETRGQWVRIPFGQIVF